eukprot:CAMPEP_0198138848 /NCGR_PEP_ID=MMETSP1443-20131203/2231_1 /TAXON_ID=186043 /ORGANISM="Entomoneis sp., Strain CCMP2396" /LENGTH=226 /DNA_ID=CAMNT_0043800789 /DNA_START=6 /DNA_END=686 /DNA_ORIENTATION=+
MMDMSLTPNDVRMFPLPPLHNSNSGKIKGNSNNNSNDIVQLPAISKSIPINQTESDYRLEQEDARAEYRDQIMYERIFKNNPVRGKDQQDEQQQPQHHHRRTWSAPQQEFENNDTSISIYNNAVHPNAPPSSRFLLPKQQGSGVPAFVSAAASFRAPVSFFEHALRGMQGEQEAVPPPPPLTGFAIPAKTWTNSRYEDEATLCSAYYDAAGESDSEESEGIFELEM